MKGQFYVDSGDFQGQVWLSIPRQQRLIAESSCLGTADPWSRLTSILPPSLADL